MRRVFLLVANTACTVLKKSFSENEDPVFDVKGTLIRLKEGNCFLFFETFSMGKSQPFNALYQIKKDGSLKSVIDADTLWQEKYGDDCYFSIDEVKNKKILITTGCMNYRVGCFSMTLEYNLSNGKLKKNSSYSTDFSFASPDGIAPRSNSFTLASSIDVYKESSLETKSFKLKKNDMVMIMQVKLSSGKLYMKVMRAGDGKKGWISCNKTKPYANGSPLFLETFYMD